MGHLIKKQTERMLFSGTSRISERGRPREVKGRPRGTMGRPRGAMGRPRGRPGASGSKYNSTFERIHPSWVITTWRRLFAQPLRRYGLYSIRPVAVRS